MDNDKTVQDYLTSNPTVTYFKNVYGRYTDFSSQFKTFKYEDKPICISSKNGDLVQFYLLIEKDRECSLYELIEDIETIIMKYTTNTIINIDAYSYLTYLLINEKSINMCKCYNEESKIVYKYFLDFPLGIDVPLYIPHKCNSNLEIDIKKSFIKMSDHAIKILNNKN